MKVLVTGAAGNGGQAVCKALVQAGYSVRMADIMPPIADDLETRIHSVRHKIPW